MCFVLNGCTKEQHILVTWTADRRDLRTKSTTFRSGDGWKRTVPIRNVRSAIYNKALAGAYSANVLMRIYEHGTDYSGKPSSKKAMTMAGGITRCALMKRRWNCDHDQQLEWRRHLQGIAPDPAEKHVYAD
jgi:hypothetical protein